MKKTRSIDILLPVCICTFLICCGQLSHAAEQESPLRLTEPVSKVVADLERYIPERMHEAEIPGVSIALIRDGRVVWTDGFGVSNAITQEAVTPETVFEAASNSKVVTAYIALRLVEQGKLSFDDPVLRYLKKPWLPTSSDGDLITLRHLVSHSSGLTDDLLPLNKNLSFAPGTGFLYSGVGALYLQEIVEQVTGRSLEDNARDMVFGPLKMRSSSFVNRPDILPHKANGHIEAKRPLLFFLILSVPFFICAVLIGIVILRIIKGVWKPGGVMMAWLAVAAAVSAILTIVFLAGQALPNFVLLIALTAAGCAAVFTAMVLIGRRILTRGILRTAWIAGSFIFIFWLSGFITLPVPRGPSPQPSAVGSLRTTAPDLAAFLIELTRPEFLSKETAVQIRTPQTSIDNDFSWGLGPGIQHSAQGDALWQNGITFGFRSVMAIYPSSGHGVVVCSNSDQGLPVVYDIAGRALGGKARWWQ